MSEATTDTLKPTVALVIAQLLRDSLELAKRADDAWEAICASPFCVTCGNEKQGRAKRSDAFEEFCPACWRLLTPELKRGLQHHYGSMHRETFATAIETIVTRRAAKDSSGKRKAS